MVGGMMDAVQLRGHTDEQDLPSVRSRPAVAVAGGIAGVASG